MLDRLARRPAVTRLRQAVGVARRGLPAPPPPAPAPPAPLDLLDRTLRPGPSRPGPLALEMAARLSDADRAAVRMFLAEGGVPGHGPELADDPVNVVPLALHVGLPGVEERVGLTREEPPEEVHAMARGPLATGGSVYDADFFDQALRDAGAPLQAGAAVLDFGCSSGRVTRVLHAARPDLRIFGCDPNAPAIAWAREHLPGTEYHVSPTEPPLEFLDDDTLDAVLAMSIWSHFAEDPALRWLDEMARVIRPGGHLVLTTHGFVSVAFYAGLPDHDPEDQRPIAHELYRSGHAFVATFGAEGDWGVVSEGWGTAFFTAEWLASHALPRWSLRDYVPGAVQLNQDLYVLRRER